MPRVPDVEADDGLDTARESRLRGHKDPHDCNVIRDIASRTSAANHLRWRNVIYDRKDPGQSGGSSHRPRRASCDDVVEMPDKTLDSHRNAQCRRAQLGKRYTNSTGLRRSEVPTAYRSCHWRRRRRSVTRGIAPLRLAASNPYPYVRRKARQGWQGSSLDPSLSRAQNSQGAMAERCASEQVSVASAGRRAAAGKPLCWQYRLLGKQLTRCSHVNELARKPAATLVHEDGRPACEIVGMYFSFVNPGATCDDFTRQLVELYASINGDERRKRLEVVHVVLWSNVTDVLDFDESFRAHVADLPWLAVPNHDYERKTRLTRRYRIKAGVPTLILLEASNGSVVTRGGVERTIADPTGVEFPWRPPHPKAALEDGPLLPCGARDSDEPMLHEELRHCFKGIYFSAHWCPPCKAFTPQLVDTYQRIQERGHDFEVIFVSSDRSEDSYNAYTETMPWLRIPFNQEERRRKLARAFDVQAIPTLVILDPRDNIITLDGRAELIEDPEGLNFPWSSRLVNILTEKYATSLHDAPAIILFVEGEDCEIQFGESVLLPAAQLYRRDQPDYDPNFDDPDDDSLQFYIALDCETSDILREFIGLDDAVPLLTAIDIPRGIYAVMEYGAEITVDSVQQFVDGYLNNKLPINKIAAVHKTSNTSEHMPA